MLVGLPGCGKSTVAAAISEIENCTTGTSTNPTSRFSDHSEESGNRTNDIAHGGFYLNHDHDDELPPQPSHDIEEEGAQEQEREEQRQRKWVVACQDILKTRKKVLHVANGALFNGHSVILIATIQLLKHFPPLLYPAANITQN